MAGGTGLGMDGCSGCGRRPPAVDPRTRSTAPRLTLPAGLVHGGESTKSDTFLRWRRAGSS